MTIEERLTALEAKVAKLEAVAAPVFVIPPADPTSIVMLSRVNQHGAVESVSEVVVANDVFAPPYLHGLSDEQIIANARDKEPGTTPTGEIDVLTYRLLLARGEIADDELSRVTLYRLHQGERQDGDPAWEAYHAAAVAAAALVQGDQ